MSPKLTIGNKPREEPKRQEMNSLRILQKAANLNSSVATPQAREAQKILKSLQVYTPKNSPNSYNITIRNPVTGYRGSIMYGGGKSPGVVSFQNLETGFDRPQELGKAPLTKIQKLGTQATINQLINEIPTARGNQSERPATYRFEAIKDEKDYDKLYRSSKFGNPGSQRANLYRRMTKGAFSAYENKVGDFKGYGERIDETRWQPRGPGGKFGKYVNFDTTDVVKRIGKFAQEKANQFAGLARLATKAKGLQLATMLIQADMENYKLNPGTLDQFLAAGELPDGTPYKPRQDYPRPPKGPTKAKRSPLVIKAPPKKNTAVLAKLKGKTGSLINGVFYPHNWSFQQRMRYEARK